MAELKLGSLTFKRGEGNSGPNVLAYRKRLANAEERLESAGAGGAGAGGAGAGGAGGAGGASAQVAQAGQGIAGLYSQMFGSSGQASSAATAGPGIASMVSQMFGKAPAPAPPMEPPAPELTGSPVVDERNYYAYLKTQLLPYLRTHKSTNARIVPLETALRDFEAREAANREFGGGGKRRKYRKSRKTKKSKKTKKAKRHHRG